MLTVFSLANNKQSVEIVFQAKGIANIKALNQEYACSVGKTAWKQHGRSRVSECGDSLRPER